MCIRDSLSFEIDEGIKKSFEATRILKEVLPEMYQDETDDAQNAADPELTHDAVNGLAEETSPEENVTE